MEASSLNLPSSSMPKAFDENCVRFSKLLACINAEGEKVLNDIIRAICKHKFEKSWKTINDYLINTGWTHKMITNKFDKMTMGSMNKKIEVNLFDISFSYVVLQVVFNDFYTQLSKPCQQQLEQLKIMRNKVSHRYGEMADQLNTKVDELKVIYRELYKEYGKILGIDFDINSSDVEKRLTKIVTTKVKQNDVTTYIEKVHEWFKENTSQLIKRGREEQTLYYQNLFVLGPCVWLVEKDCDNFDKLKELKFSIEKIFTPLQFKQEGGSEVELKNIFKITKLGTNVNPNVLIFEGDPGSGKTSLLHYLLYLWCSGKDEVDELQDFDLIFFIETRKVKSDRLVKFLQESKTFHNTCKTLDPDDIIPILKELKVLFIIDEFECDEKSIEILEDILAKFDAHRIIITTTPEFKDDVKNMTLNYRLSSSCIIIYGFDVRMFTTKVFQLLEENEEKCKKQCNKFLIKLKKSKLWWDFHEHLKLPINLYLLIFFWREDPDFLAVITSSTDFFMNLFQRCQTRLVRRLNCTMEIIDELLHTLGQLALEKLQEESFISVVDSEMYSALEDKCKTENIVEEFMSAFLMCPVDHCCDSDDRIYKFLHKPQMEFLAARYLAKKISIKEMIPGDLKRDIEWENCQGVIIYLVGHFAMDNKLEPGLWKHVMDIIDLLEIPSDNYNYWWKLFVESQQNKNVQQIALPKDDWELNAEQVVSGLRILGNTQVTLKNLKIEIPSDIEPHKIELMLGIMKELKNKLKSKHNKENPISVQLHLWHHYEHICDKSSDEFVQTLYPWGHLTSFVGSVRELEPGKETLGYCFKLKSLHVHVSSAPALNSLSNSLNKIYRSIKEVHIMLAIPNDFTQEKYPRLNRLKDLELIVKGMNAENWEQLTDALKHIGGKYGFQKLTLQKSNLRADNIAKISEKFKTCVHSQIYVESLYKPSDEEKSLLGKENTSYISVVWL